MNDEGGIGIAKENNESIGDEIDMISPLPFFSHCPEIDSSATPDLPEVMDEEAIQAEERRLFGHPAIGYEC